MKTINNKITQINKNFYFYLRLSLFIFCFSGMNLTVNGQNFLELEGMWQLTGIYERIGDEPYHEIEFPISEKVPEKIEFILHLKQINVFFGEQQKKLEDLTFAVDKSKSYILDENNLEIVIEPGEAYRYGWSLTPTKSLNLQKNFLFWQGGQQLIREYKYHYQRIK